MAVKAGERGRGKQASLASLPWRRRSPAAPSPPAAPEGAAAAQGEAGQAARGKLTAQPGRPSTTVRPAAQLHSSAQLHSAAQPCVCSSAGSTAAPRHSSTAAGAALRRHPAIHAAPARTWCSAGILSNSSTQHVPRSASTTAPASNMKSPVTVSLTTDTVRPAGRGRVHAGGLVAGGDGAAVEWQLGSLSCWRQRACRQSEAVACRWRRQTAARLPVRAQAAARPHLRWCWCCRTRTARAELPPRPPAAAGSCPGLGRPRSARGCRLRQQQQQQRHAPSAQLVAGRCGCTPQALLHAAARSAATARSSAAGAAQGSPQGAAHP